MTGPHALPRLRVYRLKPPAVGKKARAKAAAATAAATAKDLYCCATLSKGATRGEQCGGVHAARDGNGPRLECDEEAAHLCRSLCCHPAPTFSGDTQPDQAESRCLFSTTSPSLRSFAGWPGPQMVSTLAGFGIGTSPSLNGRRAMRPPNTIDAATTLALAVSRALRAGLSPARTLDHAEP